MERGAEMVNTILTEAIERAEERLRQENLGKRRNVPKRRYEYIGPVDIVCFNGEISTINIMESISAENENDAKEKIYEKLFNGRLPIFIKNKDWKKYLKEA